MPHLLTHQLFFLLIYQRSCYFIFFSFSVYVEIAGKTCLEKDAIIIGWNCYEEEPHFDPEGAACGNDGTPQEGYCKNELVIS